ncbi:hypothetical protein [Flammeovirga sp. SubArs3]|uniref:hypothetical protein n=1 Tax=Flammeovirga sp. SubArs3 TaxID=2995316 RepID=UPI00248B520E|nr:hypothetical protein [Flammeovirga sp. SubArs3]
MSEPVQVESGEMIQFMDSMILKLDITGKEVKGTFDWIVSETDRKEGTLVGTIENDLIKAIYSYSDHGLTVKEEKYIKIEDEYAYFRIGGKMRLKDGVYIYTSDNDLNYDFGSKIPRKY